MNQNKAGGSSHRTPMDAALNYLTVRSRTVSEMEQYLDSKNFGEFEVYQTIERLKELGYLNDIRFAREFVDSRLRTKPVSRRKLNEQLYRHGLARDVIDEVLSDVEDDTELENAAAIALKYYEQYKELPDQERGEKIGRRLISRGFDFDVAKRCIARIENERRE